MFRKQDSDHSAEEMPKPNTLFSTCTVRASIERRIFPLLAKEKIFAEVSCKVASKVVTQMPEDPNFKLKKVQIEQYPGVLARLFAPSPHNAPTKIVLDNPTSEDVKEALKTLR